MSDTKPRILVLGGAGMIGRNFVKFCVDHDLASSIRVADKTMPEIAYFGQSHKDAFADARVTFVQADLTRDAHIERAFNLELGPYDYVYNLAGETKCGLAEAVYASKVSVNGSTSVCCCCCGRMVTIVVCCDCVVPRLVD